MIKLLVVGRHRGIMNSILGLLMANGYDALGAIENSDAITLFEENNFQGVIFGGGVDLESREILSTAFKAINTEVKIIIAHPSSILQDIKNAFQ